MGVFQVGFGEVQLIGRRQGGERQLRDRQTGKRDRWEGRDLGGGGVSEACMSNAKARKECFLVSCEGGGWDWGQCIGFNNFSQWSHFFPVILMNFFKIRQRFLKNFRENASVFKLFYLHFLGNLADFPSLFPYFCINN